MGDSAAPSEQEYRQLQVGLLTEAQSGRKH